jgi:hypothetical protein
MANPRIGKITPGIQKTLRSLVIDDTHPGSLLADIQTLLELTADPGLAVSARTGQFGISDLSQINARMTRPLQIDINRPLQKSYPNINGLYMLLRTTGLVDIVFAQSNKSSLVRHEPTYAAWQSLNPTERYFTLLEALLLVASANVIGERRRRFDSPYGQDVLLLMEALGSKQLYLKEEMILAYLNYRPGLHNVALLEMLGLISIETRKPPEGKGWTIAKIQKTALADALIGLLTNFFETEDVWSWFEYERVPAFGALQPLLRPYFPEYKTRFVVSDPGVSDQVFVLKVSLANSLGGHRRRPWRRIATPGIGSFADMANAILAAFQFDFDHLYSFAFKDRFGRMVRINHPAMDEPKWAHETRFGEAGLAPGQHVDFFYDFGDNWRFTIVVESLEPSDAKLKKPKVIQRHGESPTQYGEEDWN